MLHLVTRDSSHLCLSYVTFVFGICLNMLGFIHLQNQPPLCFRASKRGSNQQFYPIRCPNAERGILRPLSAKQRHSGKRIRPGLQAERSSGSHRFCENSAGTSLCRRERAQLPEDGILSVLGRQTPEIATQSQTEAFWWSPKTAASEIANKQSIPTHDILDTYLS